MTTRYVGIGGHASDGTDFELSKYVEAEDAETAFDMAVTYALEYARGVSVAEREIEIERFATATYVTVRGTAKHDPGKGEPYAERLTIPVPIELLPDVHDGGRGASRPQ